MSTETTTESSNYRRIALYITLGIIGLLSIIGAFMPEARAYVVEVVKGFGTYIPTLAQ